MKNIVAAVDFSNATPAVMEIAISLAKSFNAELQLLHVIEPEPTFVTYGFSVAEYPAMASFRDETIRRAKARMEELLTQARKDVPRHRLSHTRRHPAAGAAQAGETKRRGLRRHRLARSRRAQLAAARQCRGRHGPQGHRAHTHRARAPRITSTPAKP